jgi:hypothetical protein
MSAQLESLSPPVAARLPENRRVALPEPDSQESRATPLGPDRGISLLLAFTGATTVMVGDVVVVGAVGQSWILIPGVLVLLSMAAIVFAAIMRLLADGDTPDSPS